MMSTSRPIERTVIVFCPEPFHSLSIIPQTIGKDEALYKLAKKFFQSHGPATLKDFIWWSGLTATDAKRAAAAIKPEFICETIGEQAYIFPDIPVSYGEMKKGLVHFAPAFDELFVSYKDRKEILHIDHHKKVITGPGIFQPTIFLDGEIIGTWKRVKAKEKINIETTTFAAVSKDIKEKIKKEAKIVSDFYSG
jgi:hypothetical protein